MQKELFILQLACGIMIAIISLLIALWRAAAEQLADEQKASNKLSASLEELIGYDFGAPRASITRAKAALLYLQAIRKPGQHPAEHSHTEPIPTT